MKKLETWYTVTAEYDPSGKMDSMGEIDKAIEKAAGAKMSGSGYGGMRDISFSFNSARRAVKVFLNLSKVKKPRIELSLHKYQG